MYYVKIHAIGYLSKHGHDPSSLEDVEQQALFLCASGLWPQRTALD